MRSNFVSSRTFRLAVSLMAGFCVGNAVWSAPSIQSIELSPNPLATGEPFTISVTASPDATQAVATFHFRPESPLPLQLLLANQGSVWTGSGVVPGGIQHQLPPSAGATVRVAVFDALCPCRAAQVTLTRSPSCSN